MIFFLNEISPFGADFEICNFVDYFMPKHTHYTLTKIQEVKKHNRAPLKTGANYIQNKYFFVVTLSIEIEKCQENIQLIYRKVR